MRLWKRDATSFEKRFGMLTVLLIVLQMLSQAAFCLLVITKHGTPYRAVLFVGMFLTTIYICNAIFAAGQKHASLREEQ